MRKMGCSAKVKKNTSNLFFLILFVLIFAFLVFPGPVYIVLLTLFLAVVPNFKSHAIAILLMFYFSFLIASRYSGLVWNGSDDLPSYFLAYDAITNRDLGAIDASFLYAKHLDFGFIWLTNLINYLSDGNRFIYYFTVVYISFSIYYLFLYRVLKGSYALFALLLFFLFFKNIHLSMHILRSSLAIPMILLSLTFTNYQKLVFFFFAATLQASSAVLAVLTLISRDFLNRFTFIHKFIIFILSAIAFFIVGELYLFGKIRHARFSIGIGNYPIILSNIIVGVGLILTSYKGILKTENGFTWIYLYGYFVFISLFSIVFSQHTYRFSQFVLYLTPLIIFYSISSNRCFDYLKYALVLLYVAASYYTYYYILNLNESDFYYRESSDVFINGFSQIRLFFDYIEFDVGYSSFWRLKHE
ncbi:EpsG family protein [Aliivibrio fischeri]|uniref:EpsG family protein n=1 Tax=Aliivibrio fischeri TaxID=668 RepID=UPI001F32F540|nr:EpsG family protein [Aliivibrio fischeri]MCE4935497.1 EpsG family protein [Aliivibrio fischeri]